MAAESIEWHEECYRNAMSHHEQLTQAARQAVRRERESLKYLEQYARQIERAKRLGKKKFDCDRFSDKESSDG